MKKAMWFIFGFLGCLLIQGVPTSWGEKMSFHYLTDPITWLLATVLSLLTLGSYLKVSQQQRTEQQS